MSGTFSFMGITKVAEGQERRDQDLPITIPYAKLLEWQLDRALVPKDWAARVAHAKKLAREAAAALPPDVHAAVADDLLGVEDTLAALLARPGVDTSKRMFGGYADATLQQWSQVRDAFRRERCHWAHCAQLLLENNKYELPTLRRHMERLQKVAIACLLVAVLFFVDTIQQQLGELDLREALLREEAASFERQYERHCAQLGIEGGRGPDTDIGAALARMTLRLPVHYNALVTLATDVQVRRALDYYSAFLRFASPQGPACCRVLAFVMAHGNTSRLELERHLNPLAWEEDQRHPSVLPEVANEDSWEIEIDTSGATLTAADAGPVVIDWVEMEAEPVTANSQPLTAAARADRYQRETVLSAQETRVLFIDDLYELLAFLDGRAREQGSANAAAELVTASSECPDIVRVCGAPDTLHVLRAAVARVLEACESPDFVQLLEIESSKRYVARLAASVRKKLDVAEQLHNQVAGLGVKRVAMQDELQLLLPRMESLALRSQRVRDLVQAEMREHYPARQLDIVL